MLNGRYRIKRALGKGGMGTVYMAEHVRLDAIVAVKEVPGPSGNENEDREELDRCEHEARFLVRLNHPNLPKVTDAFVENDRFYLVMEYIEGVTLESRFRDVNGPLDVVQVIDWSLQIADVLSYLHCQEPPIIFRDLKPSNVMVQPDGSIRLIDFGIARRFQPGANKDTALLGSVGYSPPEQFGRHQTDARSDIYAFAATLHHLLTGRDPAIQPFKFPPARALNPAVPERLSRLLDACLALEPDARPASIDVVALALVAVRDDPSLRAGAAVHSSGRQTDPVSGGSTTGNTSPRIISAKLQEAEAHHRRSVSREIASSTGLHRRTAFVVACVLVAAVAAAAIGYQRSRLRPNTVRHGFVQPVPRNIEPQPSPPSSDNSTQQAAPSDDNHGNIAPPPEEHSVVMVSPGQVVVEQDAYLLPVTVHGIIRGHADSKGTVAVFFYDVDGRPLNATDRASNFANPDGHLSMATMIQIGSDEQNFEQTLKVPVRQFPPSALVSPIKVRGVVVVDGQSLYSEMVDVIAPLVPDTIADPNNQEGGTTPGQGGGATNGSVVHPGGSGVSGRIR